MAVVFHGRTHEEDGRALERQLRSVDCYETGIRTTAGVTTISFYPCPKQT